MNHRKSTPLLLSVLLMGATALLALPISASGGTVTMRMSGAPAPPAVVFSATPRWVAIPGTRVERVRESERPSYDLFRYGSRYYVYNDGYWYRSDRLNRGFVAIEERSVPLVFANVSSEQWRSYPPGWSNPKNPHFNGRHDNGNRPAHGKSGKGH